MKKKVLALAVAGALGAPALALAQTSTVQIYGQYRNDYNILDQGQGIKKVDAMATYDSYLGFRGEEKLGGGLSAWFQCESTFAGSGEEAEGNGWCTRNSGMGFKGGFGNVFYGVWDAPYKIIHGSVYRPFSTSGSFGNASLLHNGSVGHAANGLLGSSLASSGTATQQAGFSRRQINTINYHSPSWSGFQVLAQYSATDDSTALTSGAAPTTKPRLYSLGASYNAGPLYVGLAYEQHRAYNPAGQAFGLGAGAYSGNGKDRAFEVVAAYTFGPIRVGASYHNLKYEIAGVAADGPGALRDVKVRSWAVYGDWRIAGPHTLRLGYVQAGDVKGNGTANVNSLTQPAVFVAGVLTPVNDTGAKLFLIQYAYAFSKRTEVNFGFAKLDNERNSRHNLQSLATRNTCQGVAGGPTPAAGAATGAGPFCNRDQDAFVLGVIHRF